MEQQAPVDGLQLMVEQVWLFPACLVGWGKGLGWGRVLEQCPWLGSMFHGQVSFVEAVLVSLRKVLCFL